MLAKYRPLIWTFAGGCLSGAVLIGVVFIGVVREDARTMPDDAPRARAAERQHEPTSAAPVDDDDGAAVEDDDSNAFKAAPASPPKTAATHDGSHTEPGSSIADILLRLEAAYRKDVAAPAPQAPSTPRTLPAELSAHEKAVAVAATSAPPAAAPVAAAPANALVTAAAPARAPEREAEMRVAARDEAPTQNVYYGDVQQNTNVGSVQQGDVYVVPQVVPYAPYYALPPSRPVAPLANAPYPGIPRAVHFRNNPNPAGSGVFSYPTDGVFKYPVDLVH